MFVEQHDMVYAMCVDENMGLLEAFYETAESKDDGDFLEPGIVRGVRPREPKQP